MGCILGVCAERRAGGELGRELKEGDLDGDSSRASAAIELQCRTRVWVGNIHLIILHTR